MHIETTKVWRSHKPPGLSSQFSAAAAPDKLLHKQEDNNSPTGVCHVDLRDSGQSFTAAIDAQMPADWEFCLSQQL